MKTSPEVAARNFWATITGIALQMKAGTRRNGISPLVTTADPDDCTSLWVPENYAYTR